jgi:hypothetical protein
VKALALVLAVSLAAPAWAADDAPVLLTAGEVAPVAGVLLPDALAVRRAKDLVGCQAEVTSLKAAPAPLPPLAIVGLVVLGVVVGGAAGYGISVAAR